LISYLDVTQAAAQKSATEADIPTLETAIKQSIHRLAILCGQDPNAFKAQLAEPRPMPSYAGLVATGLPAELLARRPDLRQAERQLAAASADIGVATAGLYPKFDLTLGLGLQSNNASHFFERASRYWSIVPGISLPLFTGGKTMAQIESKQAIYDEVLARYRATFNTALEDVENALAAWYAERARQQTLAEAVAANANAVKLAQESYRRGLTTFLNVLTAENSLFTTQRSLSQSNARLLTDLVALNKALGGGWDVTLLDAGR
jgi:NodT family efflux transporter outer membrane factor (OMF) lipoprotein